MDQIYLVKLHGKSNSEFAKVSLKWINHVEQYKWYLGVTCNLLNI